MGLTLQHVQEPNKDRSHFRYRRRVPKDLLEIIGKTELIAVLGQSRDEALSAYPRIHGHFQKLLADAKRSRTIASLVHGPLTERDRYDALIERVRDLGVLDPFNPAVSEEERFQRSMMAEHLAAKYPEDPETGRPAITNKDDAFIIRTLAAKAPAKPAPTLDDAVKFYKTERIKGSDFEAKKTVQRIDRVVNRVRKTLGRSPVLEELSREDARKVRDGILVEGLKPSSVKRELNIIKAIINHAITEMELRCKNPFEKLDIAGLDEDRDLDNRDPFPADILAKVNVNVAAKAQPSLKLIWRILVGTGCRLAEVTGLRLADVVLDGQTPNITVTHHEGRGIKTKSSVRQVPLVGDTLEAVREAVAVCRDPLMLFPRFSSEKGPTNASQQLMKRVREVTDNPKLVTYSLRHNMKDRLMLSGATPQEQNLILGHAMGNVGDSVYGGAHARLVVATAAMKRAFGITDKSEDAAP